MVKINKDRVKKRRESKQLKILKNRIININININNEEKEEEKEDDADLQELMDEVRNIKTKRSIMYWTADNKEFINQLSTEHKNRLMNEIKNKFFL